MAGFTASAFHIEAETSRFVAAHLGFGGLAEKLADVIENAGISGWIRARRAPDRLLVDIDDLVHILCAVHGVESSGPVGCMVLDIRQSLIEDLIHERTFARAGLPGDDGEGTERDGHVDVLQIVFVSAMDGERESVSFSPLFRQRDVFLTAQVLPRDGVLHLHHVLRRTLRDDGAAIFPCAGTDIHDPVCGADGILIMLDDDERISQIPHALQCRKELVIVTLMQTDGRFIQDVEDTDQPGTDLRRQTNALGFAAGERRGAAGECQVVEPDIHEEGETALHLAQDLVCDDLFLLGKRDMVHEVQKVDDRHGGDLCDILPAHAESEALGLQARPMADGTWLFDEVVRERFLHLLCPRLFIAPLRHRDDTFEGTLIGLCDAFGAGVLEGEKRRAAVFKLCLCLIRQVIIACIHGEAIGFQEGIEQLVEPCFLIIRKWLDRAQTERDRVIGQDAMEIRLQ